MSSKFHFLVVDDQDIVRSIVVALLNALGYTRVSEATDGKTALQLLQTGDVHEEPINFIITDWNMPHMNGLALLKTIRVTEGLQHLPVLFVTSESSEEKIIAATDAGVDGYLLKSNLNADNLKVIISNITARKGRVRCC
ncbi:MAG TPA: response regulator [Burkholderiaceae bacterium]|jgi:two-component system chemotaxis response regulator CheY